MTQELKQAAARLEQIHEEIQTLLTEATHLIGEHLPLGTSYRARKTWIPMIDMALGYGAPAGEEPQAAFTMEDTINALHAAVRKAEEPS